LKKYIPYLLALLVLIGAILLFATGDNTTAERELDERITLFRKDKIPYGTYVAYNSLKEMFPAASISATREEPGYWDSLSSYDDKQAYVVITDRFTADKDELEKMIKFAEKGNDVFVSARYISAAADEATGSTTSSFDIPALAEEVKKNDVLLLLTTPPFGRDTGYSYPGITFNSYFSSIDSTTTDVLGTDKTGHTIFVHLKAGKGNFYIHTEPLAFSNYFLLYQDNIRYFEKALSVISPDVKKVVWDEYYINKSSARQESRNEQGWMSVLFRYPGLKAALLTAILTLLLYVLLEMRRKQRYIPVVKKPRNDSLDFVKTIGRLYHDKGDHKNLARKMASYFLEHIRTRYKLSTSTLDDEFVKALQYKSGAEEYEVRTIISFIKYLDDAPGINDVQLTEFHKQLESFYQKA
jgi:hypothetical protein